LVEEDRTSNGVSFSEALFSVYMERRRIASNKLPRGIALHKQRTIPRDDLGGDQEPFEDCVYEQHIVVYKKQINPPFEVPYSVQCKWVFG
jgi:hypothetical protein